MSTVEQQYISKELIHMVGRNQTEEEQYLLLVKILRDGCLCNPKDPGGNLIVDLGKLISEDTMYNAGVVCFCDIPIEDLTIHIAKYSKFGLSFLKSFLIKKGANPVHYIAMNSNVTDFSLDPTTGRSMHAQVTRADYFDKMFKEELPAFQSIVWELLSRQEKEELNAEPLRQKRSKEAIERQLLVQHVSHFLEFEMSSPIKFFDDSKSDEDEKNYYMEREWRILGSLNFSVGDVYRVILPKGKEYAARLSEDIPDYIGQIQFVE